MSKIKSFNVNLGLNNPFFNIHRINFRVKVVFRSSYSLVSLLVANASNILNFSREESVQLTCLNLWEMEL